MTSVERHAVRARLMVVEGVRRSAYQDSRGYWTIGVGRLIDDRVGGALSDDEIRVLLDNDIRAAEAALGVYGWYATLDSVRRGCMVDMMFNLGPVRFRGFRKMEAAVARGAWDEAADEILASRYAEQVGDRARENARRMRTGIA